jgi:hypothetical protein
LEKNVIFKIDPDVQAVLEFMQENIATDKLLGAASAIHGICTDAVGSSRPNASGSDVSGSAAS